MCPPLVKLLLLLVLLLPLPAAGAATADSGVKDPPLVLAAKGGDKGQVGALLKAGEPVDEADWAGWTALSWAALLLQVEIATDLLDHGADIEHLAPGGRSSGRPLQLSAKKYGGGPMVQLLLKRGAKVDSTDMLGRTALMRAAEHGWIDAVEALLAAGADPNLKTPGPKPLTALALARIGRHELVAERLIAAGASK